MVAGEFGMLSHAFLSASVMLKQGSMVGTDESNADFTVGLSIWAR